MQTAARRWRKAFRRLVSLAEQAGDPVVCDLPRWSLDEVERHFAYIETRTGTALPPSYKDFLTECDGCKNLFRGAGLLSLAQLLVDAVDEFLFSVIGVVVAARQDDHGFTLADTSHRVAALFDVSRHAAARH